MKKMFLFAMLILTGCFYFQPDERLINLNKTNKEVVVPSNCFFFTNYFQYDKDNNLQYVYSVSKFSSQDFNYRTLTSYTDDDIFDVLLQTCEICQKDYPEKVNKYKESILKVKKEKEEKIRKINQNKEQEIKRKATISKKYGYKWCSNEIEDNCIVEDLRLKVIQQISEGTLVEAITGKDFINWFIEAPVLSEERYFVVANQKDSNKADDSVLDSGIFVFIGTQQYQSLSGTRTVKKIKRLQ